MVVLCMRRAVHKTDDLCMRFISQSCVWATHDSFLNEVHILQSCVCGGAKLVCLVYRPLVTGPLLSTILLFLYPLICTALFFATFSCIPPSSSLPCHLSPSSRVPYSTRTHPHPRNQYSSARTHTHTCTHEHTQTRAHPLTHTHANPHTRTHAHTHTPEF